MKTALLNPLVSISCIVILLFPAIAGCTSSASETPGEWIVFASGRSGEGDIYAVHPQTKETVLVAGTAAPEGTVRYDPSKQRIVYHRYEEEPARAIVVADGQDLFEDPNGDVAPVWSSAGDQVAYVASRDGTEHIYLANGGGAGERQLTDAEATDRYPSWSPDGTSIVFARRLETGWELFTLDTVSGEERQLTNRETYVGHPAWSPDGGKIVFDTFFDQQAEIAMLDLATGEITRLTNRAGNDLIPAWSADGRHVAFGGEPDNAGNWDIWMVDVETLALERLTTDQAYDGGPVFVPGHVIGR